VTFVGIGAFDYVYQDHNRANCSVHPPPAPTRVFHLMSIADARALPTGAHVSILGSVIARPAMTITFAGAYPNSVETILTSAALVSFKGPGAAISPACDGSFGGYYTPAPPPSPAVPTALSLPATPVWSQVS